MNWGDEVRGLKEADSVKVCICSHNENADPLKPPSQSVGPLRPHAFLRDDELPLYPFHAFISCLLNPIKIYPLCHCPDIGDLK